MLKQILFIAALLASLPAVASKSEYDERVRAYIAQYKGWAQAEQQRTGIPAAITLAQGVFETSAGASELATEANNHFGIKCKKEWAGATFAHDDDAPQECFRKYNSALESYKDHSDYLKTNKRYESCFALQTTDYAGWAKQLRRCGYATNPIYAQKLIKIIEDYNLQDYTIAALSPSAKRPVLIASAASPVAAAMMAEEKKPGEVVPDRDTPTEQPEYGVVTRKDGMKGFWARSGDVLLEYAIKYKVRYAKLLEINGLPDAPLANDQFIYLEKGNTVERIIAKDVSVPVPAQAVSAPAPAVAETASVAPQLVASTAAAPTPVTQEMATPPVVTEAAPAPAVTEAAPVAEQPRALPGTKAAIIAEHEFNIANETAVEEQKPTAEPQDEFGRMKARFDKVVYAPTPAKAAPAVASAAPVATPSAPVEAPLASASGPAYHTVKTGETAFGIAKHYGITMQSLMDMNKLSFGTSIKVGQKLKVK
jgi:LysM repeat protein